MQDRVKEVMDQECDKPMKLNVQDLLMEEESKLYTRDQDMKKLEEKFDKIESEFFNRENGFANRRQKLLDDEKKLFAG